MAQGYKDFTAGAILTAADLEDYCENQSVLRFASAAARDAALTTVKVEGMMAYLVDLNVMTVYSGSAWSTIGPVHGAWTDYTPTLTQSGSVAYTKTRSAYRRFGREITYQFILTCTGTGTGSNVVTVSVPFNILVVSEVGPIGAWQIYDTSAALTYQGQAVAAAAGTIKGTTPGGSLTSFQGLAGSAFSAALAAGDVVSGTIVYETTADA